MYRKLRHLIVLMVISAQLLVAGESGDLKLPSVLGSGMVLQQNSSSAIWGWGRPNTEVDVTASWSGKVYSTEVDSSGKWLVDVETYSAGGPYSISIEGGDTIVLDNVMLGEVWVCSGQSNMYQPLSGYKNQPTAEGNRTILTSKNSNIRLFHVKKDMSKTLKDDCEGSWLEASPESTRDFSAAAYFFGRDLNRVLDVPIGLIHTSWGGTPVEAWTDDETLATIGHRRSISLDKWSQSSPSVLYNAMINPLINYTIKGVIWYQGESNRFKPNLYRDCFTAMISNWRERWSCGDFQFIFTQIAPYKYDGKGSSVLIREAQLQVVQSVENTGMAVTMDIGDKDFIHPPKKREVGERLALWAFANSYGVEGISHSGPLYREMKTIENSIVVLFDHSDNGLSSNGKPLANFEIAGEDRVFVSAEATLSDGGVKVWADGVDKPVAVRYCWRDWCVGDLYNGMGLPASSFRTDSWE